jgi:hypothetical protein
MTSVDADSSALAAAAVAAEEALCLQREALCVLCEGWGGESGSAAVDLVGRQCVEGSGVVAELHRVAGELALLADRADEVSDRRPPAAAVGDPGAAPAAQPMPAAAPAPPAWPAAGMALPAAPGLGGSLVGLAAQIAELLGDGPDLAVEEPFEEPAEEPVEESADLTGEPAVSRPVPGPAESPPAPVVTPAFVSEPVVPQPDPPSGAAAAVPPVPDPEPLLAAEVPPPVIGATEPVADPATPCEIAADELPQVGG